MEVGLYGASGLAALGTYMILFWYNEKVRFYSKVILFLCHCIIYVPILFIPIALLRGKDARNYNFIMFSLRCLSRVFGIRHIIEGLDNIDQKEAAVLIVNHQSEMDILVMGALWPHVGLATTIMKRELLFMGPYGLASYLCDSIYVDRSNPEKAHASLNNAVDYLKNKKIKIWIFPEGTTGETGTLLPFKKGAFHMAVQAQVPIIPIVVSSYSSFYRSFFFNQTPKFDHGGKLNIKVLPPVSTEGLTKHDIDSLVTSVRQSMQEAYDSISGSKSKDIKNGPKHVPTTASDNPKSPS